MDGCGMAGAGAASGRNNSCTRSSCCHCRGEVAAAAGLQHARGRRLESRWLAGRCCSRCRSRSSSPSRNTRRCMPPRAVAGCRRLRWLAVYSPFMIYSTRCSPSRPSRASCTGLVCQWSYAFFLRLTRSSAPPARHHRSVSVCLLLPARESASTPRRLHERLRLRVERWPLRVRARRTAGAPSVLVAQLMKNPTPTPATFHVVWEARQTS